MKRSKRTGWVLGACAALGVVPMQVAGCDERARVAAEDERRAAQIAASNSLCLTMLYNELESNEVVGRVKNVCSGTITSGAVSLQVTDPSGQMVYASPVVYVSNLSAGQSLDFREYASAYSPDAVVRVVKTEAR